LLSFLKSGGIILEIKNMKKFIFSRNHLETEFIKIDSRRCKACWNCVENCSRGVIGKINFLGHKHAHIDNPEKCIGCLRCVKACDKGAITALKIINRKEKNGTENNKEAV
jgi:NAD-dependent dihydropyrimidine dehydrogenase PreA subunit